VLLVGLLPWSIFVVGAGRHAWRRLRAGDDGEKAAVAAALPALARLVEHLASGSGSGEDGGA
jgi:hypothetical protein